MSVLLGVFALAIVTNFSSCKKEKETIAAIVVKNDAGLPISHARVVLHAMPLKNSLYTYNPDNYDTFDYMIKSNLDTVYSAQGQISEIFVTDWTDDNGRAEFTLPLAMILNVSALWQVDNNIERMGANIINIKEGEITTQVVEIRN
ncbi:hypothetical protein N9B89_03135 [Flavobacteriales bacterium]|nr:hypothetical protein [Flavobacteriales bacterium]